MRRSPHLFRRFSCLPQVAEARSARFPRAERGRMVCPNRCEPAKKLAFDVVEKATRSIRDVLYFLNSRPMLQFLETLTGIEGVAARPQLYRRRAAPDQAGRSARSACRLQLPQTLRLDRRINVLIYLNKDWKEEYGGHFELWDREVTRAEKKILPVFNRCAIFNTTSVSFHGHLAAGMPAGPQPQIDRDLLLHQWPAGRRSRLTHRHPVAFQERPGINRVKLTLRAKKAMRALTPPIVTDWIRRIHSSMRG